MAGGAISFLLLRRLPPHWVGKERATARRLRVNVGNGNSRDQDDGGGADE